MLEFRCLLQSLEAGGVIGSAITLNSIDSLPLPAGAANVSTDMRTQELLVAGPLATYKLHVAGFVENTMNTLPIADAVLRIVKVRHNDTQPVPSSAPGGAFCASSTNALPLALPPQEIYTALVVETQDIACPLPAASAASQPFVTNSPDGLPLVDKARSALAEVRKATGSTAFPLAVTGTSLLLARNSVDGLPLGIRAASVSAQRAHAVRRTAAPPRVTRAPLDFGGDLIDALPLAVLLRKDHGDGPFKLNWEGTIAVANKA